MGFKSGSCGDCQNSGLLKWWFWETVVWPLPKTGDFDENGDENDENNGRLSSLFFYQKITAISRLLPLEFGVPRDISPNLTSF